MTWDSKMYIFDDRYARIIEKQVTTGKITQDYVADTSLYGGFRWVGGKFVPADLNNPRVLIVTPGFSFDSACVSRDRPNDYAGAAVVAHWRVMPADVRLHVLKECAVADEPRAHLSGPVRTMLLGTAPYKKSEGQLPGAQGLAN